MYPQDLKYSKDHEWVRVVDGKAVIGITQYAADQLGDVVYVELPKVGGQVRQFEPFGVIESVKAASDLYSPVTGAVAKIDDKLTSSPELVNSDPYGEGWLIEVAMSDPSDLSRLMDSEQYQASLPKDQ